MDGKQDASERPLSVRESSLQLKIVRLENELQGCKFKIDLLDNQCKKLEEITFDMDSTLSKTKKELWEARKKVLDKQVTKKQLSEKLNSMTKEAAKFKHLFMAESNKNRCGREKLEKLISNVTAETASEATPNKFEDLKELVSVIQEGFQAQVIMVFDKLTEAENKLCPKPRVQVKRVIKKNGKPLFEFGRPLASGPGFSCGSVKLRPNAEFSFGSSESEKAAEVKPASISGLLTQTPKSSSEAASPGSEKATEVKPASPYGSLTQTPKSSSEAASPGSEKAAEVKPASIFGSLNQTPECGVKRLFPFGSGAPSYGSGSSFAFTGPSSGTGVSLRSVGTSEDDNDGGDDDDNDEKEGDDDGKAEHEAHHDGPHFEPIIPLPDKIDVIAGSSKEENFLFGSSSISSLTFQSVAASSMINSPFGQKAINTSPGFAGAGSTLFTSQSPGDEHHENEHAGDHDGPHFEPIIPLPDKIDVKTEEEEEVMFSHQAKLYRFVAEEKQWKERGVGDIKLLRNAKTGKMRVLMRREQVLKLCANHQITTDMTLQPNAGSERSWVWSTLADFSEQEYKPECLAVRFKNEDIAKQFKEKFEECQEILKNQASPKAPVHEKATHEEEVKGLLAKFIPEEGSWECDICMVRNNSDEVECVACASQKPRVEGRQDKKTKGKSLSTFGSSASLFGSGTVTHSGKDILEKFKAKEGPWVCDTCMMRNSSDEVECVACASQKPGVQVSQDKQTTGKPLFSFGSGATSSGSGFTFGTAAPSPGTGFLFGAGAKPSGTGFSIGSAGIGEGGTKPYFTFSSLNQTPNSNSRAAIAFGSLKEVGNVTGEQTEKDKKDVSQSDGETPVHEKATHEEKVKEDLLAKFKAEEGSWECDVCMVRNNSDEVECVACASQKPRVEGRQDKKTKGKSLSTFGSSASSFGSGTVTHSGKDILEKFKPEEGSWECDICMVRNSSDEVKCVACRSPKPGTESTQVPTNIGIPSFPFGSGVSFGFTGSSGGTVFSFGSAGASEDGGKPVFSFGSGAPFSFGAFPQGGNTTVAKDEEDKKGVSHSGEQASTDEGDSRREDHPQTVNEAGEVSVDDGQDKEAAPVKPIQDGDKEGHEEGLGKDLLEKWKPEEGSWECGICMVINNSDKVVCSMCESKTKSCMK